MNSYAKIKVINCSHAMYWYSAHIGKYFYAFREEADRYWVREPEGYSNFIMKTDCEVINGN